MSKNKKIIFTVVVIVATIILILLSVLSLITSSFVVYSISHIYLRLLFVPVIIMILYKCLKSQITISMKKVLVLCGCIITLDMVVVDAFRYVLSNGVSAVLFLPISLPICFMIIMIYSAKDTGRDKIKEKSLTYIVGIPLLLLSLYFEILSFVQF